MGRCDQLRSLIAELSEYERCLRRRVRQKEVELGLLLTQLSSDSSRSSAVAKRCAMSAPPDLELRIARPQSVVNQSSHSPQWSTVPTLSQSQRGAQMPAKPWPCSAVGGDASARASHFSASRSPTPAAAVAKGESLPSCPLTKMSVMSPIRRNESADDSSIEDTAQAVQAIHTAVRPCDERHVRFARLSVGGCEPEVTLKPSPSSPASAVRLLSGGGVAAAAVPAEGAASALVFHPKRRRVSSPIAGPHRVCDDFSEGIPAPHSVPRGSLRGRRRGRRWGWLGAPSKKLGRAPPRHTGVVAGTPPSPVDCVVEQQGRCAGIVLACGPTVFFD
ncbi:unnamed protein product [Trypanosoma congolense IL3000]|uniref:WGS project CAEQ00000000 data, annotated contig 766 n=1 Tax=Trypanosoma congolense (strain IL3000) TaxID=1068625 RepID=F9WIC4_TRYCI|nr:unnamed protein product [Trypanosoma congolense IL3000]